LPDWCVQKYSNQIFLIGQKLVAEGYLIISLTLYLTPPTEGQFLGGMNQIFLTNNGSQPTFNMSVNETIHFSFFVLKPQLGQWCLSWMKIMITSPSGCLLLMQ
jgi:hypothetical protein